MTGPMVSHMVKKYGANYVCIAGAVIASVGLLAASFVNTIPLLIVFYSIVTGFGFGLMYIPAVVACVPYFTKRRSLAIGICLCGSGFGTFTLAPVTHVILKQWGWRWVMRTFSAGGALSYPIRKQLLSAEPVLLHTKINDPKKSNSGYPAQCFG